MVEVAQAVESPAHGPGKPMVAGDDPGPMQRAIVVYKLGPEVQDVADCAEALLGVSGRRLGQGQVTNHD